MEKQKLWTRTFIVLMVINFCSSLSYYLLATKITEYSAFQYDLALSIAGTVMTAYVISALFCRLIFGKKIDEWGIKCSIVIGYVVNAIASVLYLVPMPFGALLTVRVFHGFGFAIMTGATSACTALVIPRERFGEGIGYFSMTMALSTGIGPFIAIWINNAFGGYFAMFVCSAVVALIAVACVPMLSVPHIETKAESAEDSPSQKEHGLASLIQVSVIPFVAVLFLCYFGYSGILTYVTMYAAELDLSFAVSFYFIVYSAVIVVARPLVGKRMDKRGENSIIYWCFASLICGFALLAFTMNGFMLLASAALAGFGIGSIQSIVQTVISRDSPKKDLGRANSTYFMSMDLGMGIGPIVIGAMIPAIGYATSYFVLGIIAACACVVYYFVHGRKQRQ